MATGEMSAIVAHGFRNSLTSIKMILQLEQESKRLSSERKKSLAVALDSIARMETMVQELLNFARPSPIELAVEDVNALAGDSMALLHARASDAGIELTQSFD